MLEKQAKEFAKEIDDSFLDPFRKHKDDSRPSSPEQKDLKKTSSTDQLELPFVKYQQAKYECMLMKF